MTKLFDNKEKTIADLFLNEVWKKCASHDFNDTERVAIVGTYNHLRAKNNTDATKFSTYKQDEPGTSYFCTFNGH